MRAFRWVVVLIFTALSLGVASAPATGFPDAVNNCNSSNLRWKFHGSLWTTQKQGWVRAGFNSIDNALDDDGSKLVTVTESASSDIDVDAKDLDPNNYGYGSSECVLGNPDIWINDFSSDAKFYYKVARHEMMHLAGAEHAGRYDSRNVDGPAAMVTCLSSSSFASTNTLDQDSARTCSTCTAR